MCKKGSEGVLKEITGNYGDTMRNLIFKTQKYINVFYHDVNNSYTEIDPMLLKNDMIGFIVCESEEILKNKLLRTVFDIKLTIRQKFNNLYNKISLMDDDTEFYIPPHVYSYLQDILNKTRINKNRYMKSEIPETDIYDLVKSFEVLMDDFKYIDDADSYIKTSKNDMLKILKEADETIRGITEKLSEVAESSPSIYNSLLIVHELMKYMVISYMYVSNIKLSYSC